jgi:hypothetical protein
MIKIYDPRFGQTNEDYKSISLKRKVLILNVDPAPLEVSAKFYFELMHIADYKYVLIGADIQRKKSHLELEKALGQKNMYPGKDAFVIICPRVIEPIGSLITWLRMTDDYHGWMLGIPKKPDQWSMEECKTLFEERDSVQEALLLVVERFDHLISLNRDIGVIEFFFDRRAVL